MALARWQATIVDVAGNVISGAQITVRREVAGAPLANLFQDRDGLVGMGNPFPADATGFAAFHVAGGAYRIDATNGVFTRTWRYVGIGTASECDVVDAAGFLRIGTIQIAWGPYGSSSAGTPPTITFAAPFANNGYRLTLTPVHPVIAEARVSMAITKAAGSFTAQTFNAQAAPNTGVFSGVGGDYIAVGPWQ